MKRNLIIVGLILFIGAYFLLNNKDFSSSDIFTDQLQKTMTTITQKTVEPKLSESETSSNLAAQSILANSTVSNKTFSNDELDAWVDDKVKKLEMPTQNPIAYELEVKEMVSQLSDDQIQEFKKNILDSELPINRRIFTNYAMTLSDKPNSLNDLYELSNSKPPDFSNVQPHTEDEVKRAQEYALRYTQIDALFNRAQNGEDLAKVLLKQISETAADLKILNYAKRKFSELN